MIQEYFSTSAEETRTFGAHLGSLLQAGDVVAFTGDLGAGKTCCIQGLAIGLGVPESTAITSPTYTLIHEYQGRIPLYHFDVYRLDHAEALYELGYEEYFYGAGVTVIEWADRIRDFLPDDHLAIHLSFRTDETRSIHLQAYGSRYDQRMQTLAHQVSLAHNISSPYRST